MVTNAIVRQFAAGQHIAPDVADQEIVLVYALALLNEGGLTGVLPGGGTGPLLFKGGTALRKCVFGSTGRFSVDVDFDAERRNGYEVEIERLFGQRRPYCGIEFSVSDFRYSHDGNFSATIAYRHSHGGGRFEVQISYRESGILLGRTLRLADQSYFRHLEIPLPELWGLDPYEMIGEKLMACNRRMGSSGKDPYDLSLWAGRPFSEDLVRRMAVLKCWTDRQRPFDPRAFLESVIPRNFRWDDVQRLIPHGRATDTDAICRRVRDRFAFLAHCTQEESQLLADYLAHRQQRLFEKAREQARGLAEAAIR